MFVSVNSYSWEKVGEYDFKWAWLAIYTITLETPEGSPYKASAGHRINITYKRNFNSEQILSQTLKEWEYQGISRQVGEPWLLYLEDSMPNMSKGDTLTLEVSSVESALLRFNNKVIDQFEDAQFIQNFAGIWLGEKTSHPKMRKYLLAGSDYD